jgi:diguanylate cyclase (GGDEF)-like protein
VPPASEATRIRSLAMTARALGRSEALLPLLEIAAEDARAAMQAASVSVSRLLAGTLTVRTIVNVGDLGPHEVRWPENETYTMDEFAGLQLAAEGLETWAWSAGDPACPAPERALLEELGKGSSLAAAIFVDGRLWGEFYATRHRGEPTFDDLDTAYLEALIAIVSGAVSRAQREDWLQQLAYRDPLTGLPNRRALDEHAATAFATEPGRPQTVTAVTIDINRLKVVNDTLGHVAGDQLIQAVARDLEKAYARLAGALVSRVGGDEFTVLVIGPDPAAAVRISDRLCRRTWQFGEGAGVSAGAASVTIEAGSTLSPTALFAAADRAQYVAKRGGLTSTVVSHELGTSSV